MDIIYYLTGISITLLILLFPFFFLAVLIKPTLITNRLASNPSRKRIASTSLISFVIAFFGMGTVLGVTEPESLKQERLAQTQLEQKKVNEAEQTRSLEAKKAAEIEAAKPKKSTATEKQAIAFTKEQKEDGTLPKGQTKIVQAGVNGEEAITYEVTTVKGKETSRQVKSKTTTTQPIAEITAVGTYVAPAPAPSSSGDGYINSSGNYVPSPSSNPSGATARCSDGTYSYSQSRRGTCSHHGGVAEWL